MPQPMSETINLRIGPAQKTLIDCAAEMLGKSRSAFILEQSLKRAEEVVAEQTVFRLSDEQWKEFTRALDAPAKPNEALANLLATPAPWEK